MLNLKALKSLALNGLLLTSTLTTSIYAQYEDGNSILEEIPKAAGNCEELKFRTFDGTCNNLKYTSWGAPNRVFHRGPFEASYKDAFTGEPLIQVDTRKITNLLSDSGQPPSFTGSPLGDDELSSVRKSMFEIFFGQFVNHDIEDAALMNGVPGSSIANVTEDTVFNTQDGNPWNRNKTPDMMITLSLGRVLNSTFYPANLGNSYLDLSAIYGEIEDDVLQLRAGEQGLMETEDYIGNGGIYNLALKDVPVNQMPPSTGKTGIVANLAPPQIDIRDAMVSGDTRCSENIQLCIIHAIWIREHNFQARRILAENPDLADDDEEIFQRARKITIAEYQHVVYNEYLPAILGFKLPPYKGYDPKVYVDTSTHFAGAAFRYGHSNIRPYDILNGCTGEPIVLHPDYKLGTDHHPNRFFFVGRSVGLDDKEMDYTPVRLATLASAGGGDGIDNIIVSMLRQPTAEFDLIITNALRNMPGVMDLYAIDIFRGRLLGLADYNTYRAVYHPAGDLYNNDACDINATEDSIECFSLITSNLTVAEGLKSLYLKVNQIDAIVGMFAEDKSSITAPLPPTITNIIRDEFERKRIGDRFYYEGNTYTDEEKTLIRTVTMKAIIERTTGVAQVQINPFKTPGEGEVLPNSCDAAKNPKANPKANAKTNPKANPKANAKANPKIKQPKAKNLKKQDPKPKAPKDKN